MKKPAGHLVQRPDGSTKLPAGQGMHAAALTEPLGAVWPGGHLTHVSVGAAPTTPTLSEYVLARQGTQLPLSAHRTGGGISKLYKTYVGSAIQAMPMAPDFVTSYRGLHVHAYRMEWKIDTVERGARERVRLHPSKRCRPYMPSCDIFI